MDDLMTVVPLRLPRRLLTVADYAALPEDIDERWELVEGNFVMSPSPTPAHNVLAMELGIALKQAAPDGLVVVPDVDLDLQLVPENEGATVRRPDVVVVTREGFDRVGRDAGFLRASEAVLVVEVISPGSRRTDRLVKAAEYADAGIANYWIVDLDAGPALTPCRLGPHGYPDSRPVTGTFETAVPFPVSIDLDSLG